MIKKYDQFLKKVSNISTDVDVGSLARCPHVQLARLGGVKVCAEATTPVPEIRPGLT